jgi:ATP-dependent protease ClpP protease subunit
MATAGEYDREGIYVTDARDSAGVGLIVRGTITDDLASSFEKAVGELTGFREVWLDSPGGDVDAAMRMGRTMRNAMALARIAPDSKCLSSCVFVFAGATQRINDGILGIHRPYLLSPEDAALADWQAWYDNLRSRVNAYLREVNVRGELFDEMVQIPPERMRYLSEDEAVTFGLGPIDHVYAEMATNRAASRLGVSRDAYERLSAKADEKCAMYLEQLSDNPSAANKAWSVCREAVLKEGADSLR